MKTFKNILPLLLALFAFAGCSDDLTYVQGMQEDPNCYGVYFPKKQSTTTQLEVEPGTITSATYTVKRRNVIDPITVPLVVKSNAEEVFEVEPLQFEAGSNQATLTINFPKAEMGKNYKCDITIEDTRYVSVYGKDNPNLSISLVLAKWEKVTNGSATTGRYRDDIFGNFYSLNSPNFNPNPEVEVEIFERSDKKGLYRMKVYNNHFVEVFAGSPMNVESKDVWTYVDASDPDKVFCPYQGTGLTLVPDNGQTYFASSVPENFSLDESAAQYGSLKNGIISFPAQSLVVEWPESADAGSFYFANNNGKHRILLPGAKVYDYSVSLSKSEPKDGIVNIGAQLGDNVAKLRYAFFAGKLNEGEAMVKSQDIATGKVPAEEITETGVIAAQNLEGGTGMYTLVGCIYDEKGTQRGFAHISFGFIAKDDDCPVLLTIGLEATNEFAGIGVNTDNSAKLFAYGENIESIKYGLFKTKNIADINVEEVLRKEGQLFTQEQLGEVNAGHFSQMLTGLNGDSDYTFAALAYNGYISKVFTASIKTTGKFNPGLEPGFVYSDFMEPELQPKKEYLVKTSWKYYGMNLVDEKPVRRRLGTVTITDDPNDVAEDDSGVDLLKIKGLSAVEFDEGGELFAAYVPTSQALTMGGMFGAISPRLGQAPIGKVGGEDVICGCMAEEDTNNVYAVSYPFIGGAIADGYIYFVPTPAYVSQGKTFRFMYTASMSAALSLVTDMLLVDPDKDMGGIPDEVEQRMAQLRHLASQVYEPKNYVELPIFSTSVQEAYREMPRNLAQGFIPASAPEHKNCKADVEFTAKNNTDAPVSTDFNVKKTQSANVIRK